MKSTLSKCALALALLALAPATLAQTCKFVSKLDPLQCNCPLADRATVNDPWVWAQSGDCDITQGNTIPGTVAPLLPAGQPMFVNELPRPIFYEPDTSSFPGSDYYEIAMKEVTQLGVAFPQPVNPPGVDCPAQPPGTQFLGLRDPLGCALFTPVWGYGQTNGGLLGGAATYPSMSFKAQKGRPVKVKWVNDLASPNHLFCPDPTNSDVPCAIDRTLMGTLRKPNEPVNPFGTRQQPDNAMVVHLHGGEIPPDSDGFAELWIGSGAPGTGGTADAYGPGGRYYTAPYDQPNVPGATANIDPEFIPPSPNDILSDTAYRTANWDGLTTAYAPAQLQRPLGNSIFYNYPMVQEPATIWYHDHTLGKTRVNVAAGPAGYFYVTDPAVEGPLHAGGALPDPGDCSNAGILAGDCRDIPIVLQDRAFNADGSINFPNGLGQPVIPGVLSSLAPGGNPDIHPQWVPEYFGDVAVVNGVAWPKITVQPRAYRFRLLDGSNARCYTLSLKSALVAAPSIWAVGSDQGYLPAATKVSKLDICPGERYDVVVDFSTVPGAQILLDNAAGAPFPNGIKPIGGTPFGFVGTMAAFDVANAPPAAPWLPTALVPVRPPLGLTADAAGTIPLLPNQPPPLALMPGTPKNPGDYGVAAFQQMILNEVLDPVTLAPAKVQIDGRRFEDPVEQYPVRDSIEVWSFVNTTVDAHPIHLHLVQFMVVGRQKFDVARFARDTGLANPGADRCPLTTFGVPCWNKLDVSPFLLGRPKAALSWERGYKDTVVSYPGEVVTVVAKWKAGWADAPTATGAPFWEPVTAGPYVWHCHIVDHEDNEMMRPSLVVERVR